MQPSVLTNHVMLHNFRKRNNTFDNFCDGQFTHYLYSIVRPNQTTNSSTVDKKNLLFSNTSCTKPSQTNNL